MLPRAFSENSLPENLQSLHERWDRRRRLFYLLGSLAGVPSILAVWFQHRLDNPFIALTYPPLILAGVLWSIALLFRRVPLSWIEKAVLFSVSLLFLSKLVYLLFFLGKDARTWNEVEAVFWVIALLFILGYIAMERRWALIYSLSVLAFTVGVGLVRFWGYFDETMVEYVRLEARVVAISFFLFILARTRDEFNRTLMTANAMQQMANTDSLTFLPNRRWLTQTLEERLYRKKRFTLILVDIDHFKQINDTYGHEVGDAVLREVSDCLHHQIRAGDVIGRWGGEEFLIIASEEDGEGALQLAYRLRETLENFKLEAGFSVTASFGVSLSREDDTMTTLLKRADLALYRAKNNGRNRVEWEAP
ncbi:MULTISPECIES: diguanylate cyclase [Anaerolinea]|uniref:GGDEF domain-containing protein n=1 Tax=Anaerolinea TaxID=233189 RepID=UPI0026137F1F|nr:GGDEF domain-containing protein [Anaerolinea thermophila]